MVGGGKDREEMRDLISRKEAIELLRKNMSNDIQDQIITENNINLIESLPIAFDTEKVIEQLACNSRFIDDINEHNIKCISCVIGQKTAIDIVKKGGVE